MNVSWFIRGECEKRQQREDATESQELHSPNLNHEELESLGVALSSKQNLGWQLGEPFQHKGKLHKYWR